MIGRTLVWLGLGVLAAAAGCTNIATDDVASSEAAASSVYDDFESLPTGTGWADGSVHGKWTVVFNGYGSVGVEATGTGQVMHLKPASPTSSSDTRAALVRSNDSFGDIDVSVRMKTVSQNRTSAPNPWEMGWFAWHYTDNDHFYYLVLKPNGWELGKRDPAYPGGQRFLATGSSPTFPVGYWHKIRVKQTAGSISVLVDGNQLTSFTDTERPYASGNLALYTEDAHVHFDDVTLYSASTSTSTGGTTTTDAGTTTTTDSGTSTSTTSTDRIYGVTVDDISSLSNIVESLQRLPHKPTTRIVFDEFVPASYYVSAVGAISNVSYTMGEILDSFYVNQYSTADYLARTDEYLSALGGKVDLWEVGNEINGEWLGDTATVVAKMSGAYDKVKAAGKRTELTLYYNQGCWEKSDHEMFTWAQANIPDRMKQGLDTVLVSYYEDDCNGLQPDWQKVFDRLATMFPSSKLGIGECGTTTASKKADYIKRYYGLNVTTPRFVGGAFWWYFREDMVPYTNPLWSTLSTAMQ